MTNLENFEELPQKLKIPSIRGYLKYANGRYSHKTPKYYFMVEMTRNKEEVRFASGIIVEDKNLFDVKLQKFPFNSDYQALFERIQADLRLIINTLVVQRMEVTPKKVWEIYRPQDTTPTIFEFLDTYFEKRVKTRFERGEIVAKTYQRQISMFRLLKHALKRMGATEIKLKKEELTNSFFEKLENQIAKGKSKLLKPTHTRRHTELFTRILDYAKFCDLIAENPINQYTFQLKRIRKSTVTFLPMEEIWKLQNLRIANKLLHEIRDLFLFQCFTGLAYCDLVSFDYIKDVGMIDEVETIIKIRQKTEVASCLPFLPEAKALLIKYKYQLPFYRNDHYNKYLKEVFALADISAHHHAHTHLARKTFGNMMLEKGFDIHIVAKMLGHLHLSTTMQYYARHTAKTVIQASKNLLYQKN